MTSAFNGEKFVEQLNIVAILGTGATGFSFLLLFVSYLLTSKVQNKLLEVELKYSGEQLKVWQNLAHKQIENTRYFMAVCILFLLAGLSMLVFTNRAEASFMVRITPAESEHFPRVYVKKEAITLDRGRGDVKIKSDQSLDIEMDSLMKELADERIKRIAAESGQRMLTTQPGANPSGKSGFGF
jgi:hypothetical protein